MNGGPSKFKHEVFALSLLLCTPSRLNRAWTGNKTPAEIEKLVGSMKLSPELQQRALDFIAGHAAAKPFFQGIADIIKASNPEYAGPDPHPCEMEEADIIKALQALDKQHAA